jgi:beta-N-acetylhexosaminidase
VYVFLVFILITNAFLGSVHVHAQQETAEEKARQMLNLLSPEERVGQLFLVTYMGTEVGENTPIYDFIVKHHIGGVVLLSANDNFISGEEALTHILTMNRQLQLNRWAAAQQPQQVPGTDETRRINFLPLLIGTYQEGDSSPYDQILTGITPLPNNMAIGATWDTQLAQQVGNVLGSELTALGINLLIGPSLDVLETPKSESSSDLATRAFGGDPFWVGEMGRAYITGIHQGSNNRVATIAKHFPGNGGADRPAEEEVATVRKSLDQLNKIDLVPFFAVTGDAPSAESTTDALLASHIRYQGFQENIRATTRPVSFDPQALDQLMSLSPISNWREAGGLVVSDNLGNRAVRNFYELTGQSYEARRVALNAFLAGNDLLYLGDMSDETDPDSNNAVLRTLDFFTQKYREDPAFAQRVDESALRILALKYRLYPVFNPESILPELEGLADLGTSNQISFDVAREAATLISPSVADLDIIIPDPPNQFDRIVFINDVRTAKQCSQCPDEAIFPVDAVQQAVLRLYGPQAGSQVLPFNMTSHSFDDLLALLDGPRNSTQIEVDLRRAQWIVFGMMNISEDNPVSQALPRFLAERPDLFQQKRLIVFAFNAPYFLDATNISKLTAYYGLYSKISSFVDVAARLLFNELTPQGLLPVSVPGVGYDLITATSPDPNQIIPLTLDTGEDITTPLGTTATPGSIVVPNLRVGDNIAVRTGMILDRNGHSVPDGTPVQFIISSEGVVSAIPQVETTGGIARANIQVTSSGLLEIRVESEPAKQSEVLRFDIPQENTNNTTTTPTEEPTQTPEPTPSPTPLPPPVTTPEPPKQDNLTLIDWLVAVLLAVAISFASYRLAALMGQVRWGIRSGFFTLIGGLIGYCYLALSLPGSVEMLASFGGWAVLLMTSIGSMIGLLATWIWRMIRVSATRQTG